MCVHACVYACVHAYVCVCVRVRVCSKTGYTRALMEHTNTLAVLCSSAQQRPQLQEGPDKQKASHTATPANLSFAISVLFSSCWLYIT